MICITGFETFGGFSRNTSQEIIRGIQQYSPFCGKVAVETLLLPVEQKGSFERLQPSLKAFDFSHIFLLGMAANSTCLSIEKVAINWAHYTIADNAHQQPLDEFIIPGAPLAYFSTFPVLALMQRCSHTEIPVQISLSAGSYVCNDLYYRTLHWVLENHSSAKTVFIHLPAITEPDQMNALHQQGFSFEVIYRSFLCLAETGILL